MFFQKCQYIHLAVRLGDNFSTTVQLDLNLMLTYTVTESNNIFCHVHSQNNLSCFMHLHASKNT